MIFKIKFFLFLSLLFSNGFAQTKLPIDEEGNIKFDSIVNIDSAQALDLYNKALFWFGQNFKSPMDAIKLQIPESHTIIANGVTDLEWPLLIGGTKAHLSFKITIACKKGKYRYTISDLEYYDKTYSKYAGLINVPQKTNSKGAEKARKNVMTSIGQVISSLNKEMIKNENW